MKFSKALRGTFLAIITSSCLCGCGGSDIFPTPYTDACKLSEVVKPDEKFTEPSDGVHALGEITIAEVVDGDTFHFYNGRGVNPKTTSDISYPLRFEGVNTPESTARIEPWGVKASQFVKSILWDNEKECQRPYSVVVQNDVSVYGQLDGTSSNRYLGFVWYKMNENSDYRLLNLELIEQCYSKNLLSSYSSFCPYYDSFVEAAKDAQKSKKRIFGEKDPGYDYTNSILDVTIHYLLDNYENLGVSSTDTDSSSDSGVNVRLTALILGFSGDSTFIRDVTDPYNDGKYASIYVYTALTVVAMATTFRVGQVITFVGKATMYHNNVQITDVKNLTTGSKDEKITVELDPKDYGINLNSDWQDETKVNEIKKAAKEKGWTYDLMPIDRIETFNSISNINDFEKYIGDFVKIKVTVRPGDEEDEKPTLDEKVEDCYRLDSDGQSITYFAKTSSNAKIAIRSVFYQKGYYGKGALAVGLTYYVIGQIARHYKTYQIVVPNKSTKSPAFHGTDGFIYLAE